MAKASVGESKVGGADVPKIEVVTVAKNLINLFAEPNTSSEVVTQALINAELRIEKQEHGFCFVVGDDRYRGWADLRHVVSRSEAPHAVQTTKAIITALYCDVFKEADNRSELVSRLVVASEVELVTGSKNGEFEVLVLPGAGRAWVRRGDLTTEKPTTFKGWADANEGERTVIVKSLGKSVLDNAKRFIGVPYLWGGCSPFGIDCSGLVQVCYKLEGLQLLRDADLQFADRRFRRIEAGMSLGEAKFEAGDLLVFGKTANINHIGIASGDGRFIHASGRQSNFGTYFDQCSNEDWGEKYLGAVRLRLNADLSVESA